MSEAAKCVTPQIGDDSFNGLMRQLFSTVSFWLVVRLVDEIGNNVRFSRDLRVADLHAATLDDKVEFSRKHPVNYGLEKFMLHTRSADTVCRNDVNIRLRSYFEEKVADVVVMRCLVPIRAQLRRRKFDEHE